MTLKIEFNTDGDQPEREAGALMALLVTLYPNAGDAAVAGLTIGQHVETTRLSPEDVERMVETQRRVDEAAARAVPYDPTPDIGPEPTPEPALSAEQAFGAPVPQPQAAAASAQVAAAPSVDPAAPAAPVTEQAAPTAPGSPAAGSVERDAEGLPWHKDIHSSNHQKSANGKWMKRRGVDNATWERVRAELFAENTARTVAELRETGPVPPPPPAAAPVPPVAHNGDPAQMGNGASAAPPPPPPVPTTAAAAPAPAPTAAAPAPPAAAVTAPDAPRPTATPEKIARFGQMMTRINAAEKSGTLPAGHAAICVRQMGLTALVDLMKCDDDTFAAFDAMITGVGA